jgi:zinc transport system ATP-binding protein
MNKEKQPILQLQHVSFSFEKGSALLSNISATIYEKQWVAIIGPNGCGKTTLLQLMMGFLKPQEGSVSLFNSSPEKHHLSIGYVPQVNRYDQQFPISVLDVVLMGGISKITWFGTYPKASKMRAMECLELVKLSHLKNQSFGTLSGGQAQRVLIARALMNFPKILFLDEPTANIDPETQKEILHLLSELKHEMTIVMVTHHLQSFIHQVNRVLCIQNQLTELTPEQTCHHFSLGVFHSPLIHPKRESRD